MKKYTFTLMIVLFVGSAFAQANDLAGVVAQQVAHCTSVVDGQTDGASHRITWAKIDLNKSKDGSEFNLPETTPAFQLNVLDGRDAEGLPLWTVLSQTIYGVVSGPSDGGAGRSHRGIHNTVGSAKETDEEITLSVDGKGVDHRQRDTIAARYQVRFKKITSRLAVRFQLKNCGPVLPCWMSSWKTEVSFEMDCAKN